MSALLALTQDRLMELLFGGTLFVTCLIMYIRDLMKGNQ